MKLSEKWLREWVSPKMDTKALAHRMTMAGLEVGSIEPVAPNLDHVVVGKIESLAPHPSADTLRLCRVNVGGRQVLDIVCGAPNAAEGMKAPVALVGATLPNGQKIQNATIRGAPSAGMLCSAKELGLSDADSGLLVLDDSAKAGSPLSKLLELDDVSLEVELTPNRGDCLSVAGLARELAAITATALKPQRIKAVQPQHRQQWNIQLAAKRECPRYVGRVVRGINPKAVTPLWMQEKLRRSGLRSIHPIVDITNYVMLELGQPMHAFDLSRIRGSIRVRLAQKNESLQLLDGNTIRLLPGSLLIADDQQPLALAGIMGGFNSAVTDQTMDLFLESAWFRPEIISLRAREYGLQTESSYRFERGVDPGLTRSAMERATELLVSVVGGKPGPVIEKIQKNLLPRPPRVPLRLPRVQRMLGADISAKAIENFLKRLGMKIAKTSKQWSVVPPSYRFDINREVDLIEEIARLYGYDHLPSRRPVITMMTDPIPEADVGRVRLRSALIDRDYQEVITYSFIEQDIQSLIDPQQTPARLANPISADMAVMRTSLWPGLLQTIRYNHNRQQTRVRVFEEGAVFVAKGPTFQQVPMLAGAVTGTAFAEQWGMPSRPVDFHDVKADVVAVLSLSGLDHLVKFIPNQHPVLHPGQSAEILLDGTRIGLIGVVHPIAQNRLGLDHPAVVFELEMTALRRGKIPVFQEFSRFPSIRRDLAILVDETTSAETVLDCVRGVAGALLVNLELFDEYRGKGIDSGRKSLALGLTFQDSSRTLNEEDVEQYMTRVVTALKTQLGALPRQ